MKSKYNRKRIRCKSCKKRVNIAYKKEKGQFYCFCPNCGSHGEFKIRRLIIK